MENKNTAKNKKKVTKKVNEVKSVEQEVKVVEPENKKSFGRKLFDWVFWIGITLLAIIWLTDFIKIQNEKDPVFCLSRKTHEFEDGTVEQCVGLGYNIYEYDRESLSNAVQFSPFFIGMKK